MKTATITEKLDLSHKELHELRAFLGRTTLGELESEDEAMYMVDLILYVVTGKAIAKEQGCG